VYVNRREIYSSQSDQIPPEPEEREAGGNYGEEEILGVEKLKKQKEGVSAGVVGKFNGQLAKKLGAMEEFNNSNNYILNMTCFGS